MPAGRAARAVEAPAESIDGTEHSAMLVAVMAGGWMYKPRSGMVSHVGCVARAGEVR